MFMEDLLFNGRLSGEKKQKNIDGSWKKLSNLKAGQGSNPRCITHQLQDLV